MNELKSDGASNAQDLQHSSRPKVRSPEADKQVISQASDFSGQKPWQSWPEDVAGSEEEVGVEEAPFKTLTAIEAKALVARSPQLSPWRIVGLQAVVGGVIAGLWWLATGQSGAAWSALCGVAAVVLPNALMAWGMTKLFRGIPGAAVLGFMFWELIKIMTAVALLAAAAVWMPDLNWLALLVGLIGCLKVNWLALLMQGWMNRKICDKTRDGN
jgi:ATP synthase protein I